MSAPESSGTPPTAARPARTRKRRFILFGMGLLAAAAVVALLASAVDKVREAAERQLDAHLQVVLALHNYHSSHGRFPPAAVHGADGKPLYSWRVLILPYI